jgi:hypothetical protein
MPDRIARPVLITLAALGLAIPVASADVVSDWNATACQVVYDAKLSPAMANRAIALTQTAVFAAVNRITGRYPAGKSDEGKVANASLEAAVAAANRAILSAAAPAQRAAIDAAYEKAVAAVADADARKGGIAVGERAAAAVLEARHDDGAMAAESYRPPTRPGVYTPTTIPAALQWAQRKPWMLARASQFRPGPPPALDSTLWARDYNEIKAVGAAKSTTRTPAQTEIAKFWEANMPSIYYAVLRAVATQPGRDVTRNARLYAAVGQGMDDALIAAFDAKYHYQFWRPITAIRNGDQDGNEATERDASWVPFIETPMHPEYPCAHCILAATVGTILKAELGRDPMPEIASTSYTAEGVTRRWTSVEDLMQEVDDARIYDGVHYRNSTEVGTAMGKQVGALAVQKHFAAAANP